MSQEKEKVGFNVIVNTPPSGKYIDMRALRKSVNKLIKKGKALSLKSAVDLICSEQLPDMDSKQLDSYLCNKI